MANLNHVITLGIGTPADIPHFILVGLSPEAVVYGHETRIVGLDAYQAVDAGLGTFRSMDAGLSAFASLDAGLDAFAALDAGLGDRAIAAGLDVFVDADAGLDDVR